MSSDSQPPPLPPPGPAAAMPARGQGPISERKAPAFSLPLVSALASTSIWWVLAGGEPGSWIIGAPAVVAATWAAHRMGTAAGLRLSLLGLLAFVPFFLWESLRGGVDVALRTLARPVRVDPGFLRYRTGLVGAGERVFLVDCVSLLPGTLAAELDGEWLTIHALSAAADNVSGLRRLERAIARLFPQGPQEPR